jgi:acyl-CoA thioester hydrolase
MIQETSLKQRILFADTDAGGMMYFGQAARWVEAGMHEWFRTNDLSFLGRSDLNLFWVVRELRTLYSKPIVFDEEITILTRIRTIQRYSLNFDVEIMGNGGVRKLCSFVRLVPMDRTSQKTTFIPDEIFNHRHLFKTNHEAA